VDRTLKIRSRSASAEKGGQHLTQHDTNREQRGYEFLPDERVATYPALYSGEDIPILDKVVFDRFFIGAPDDERASQWWLCEYDPEQGIAFGFAVLVGDTINAEFGYFSPLGELESLRVPVRSKGIVVDEVIVHRDLFWEPKPISEAVPKSLHQGWWER